MLALYFFFLLRIQHNDHKEAIFLVGVIFMALDMPLTCFRSHGAFKAVASVFVPLDCHNVAWVVGCIRTVLVFALRNSHISIARTYSNSAHYLGRKFRLYTID